MHANSYTLWHEIRKDTKKYITAVIQKLFVQLTV